MDLSMGGWRMQRTQWAVQTWNDAGQITREVLHYAGGWPLRRATLAFTGPVFGSLEVVVRGVVLFLVGLLAACDGDDPAGPLIVDALELTTTGDGFTVDVRWDAAGGDDMLLGVDTDYTLGVTLFDGASEVTDRVRAEPERYQLFVTGMGVDGPAASADPALLVHTYDDDDGAGAPLGLAHRLDPAMTGSGELVVTLQDLGEDKDAGLADTVRAEGLKALPGSTVAEAVFPVTVL